MREIKLNWTGHALVDVGIATLCAMSDKGDPSELVLADLDAAAAEMEEAYFSGALTSYLTCVFMNSEYVQPGMGEKKGASRRRYAERVLRAYRSGTDPAAVGQVCVFSGQPATHLIHRGQMPLLTGEGVLNFFPNSAGGLFVAGPYLTAIQALPFGGRRSEGKLLVVNADNSTVTIAIAKKYVEDNRRLLALTRTGALPQRAGADESLKREQASWDAASKRPKYPDAKSAPTLVTADLLDIFEQIELDEDAPVSIEAYWLSSSGQGPSLEIFTVPCNLIRFLRKVNRALTAGAWKRLVARGWPAEVAKNKPRKGAGEAVRVLKGPGRSRNEVLTGLLELYSDGFLDARRARQFVRRHLLSEARGKVEQAGECSWELTDLFLREVLSMTQDRIEHIKGFADALATHIHKRNDKGFFRSITFARRPWEVRNALTKAQRNAYSSDGALLFNLENYLQVFEADDSAGAVDWSLVRDLISIRLVEKLHEMKSLTPEMLAEEVETEVGV